jgi:hypothetical protein
MCWLMCSGAGTGVIGVVIVRSPAQGRVIEIEV